jgi:hypothetical protein
MQKVVGSNPISRFRSVLASTAVLVQTWPVDPGRKRRAADVMPGIGLSE